MRFSILGPLEIVNDAGQAVSLTRPLHRSALGLLLLHAGQACSAASLTAGLWADDPPLNPVVSLRSCVYGIRKVLPDASRLRTHPSGYLVTVRPGELDLDDFRDLVGRGRAALDGGNLTVAAALLGQALNLWREPPLADVPAVQQRDRLLDQRKEAQDALADARLALGEHRQLVAELRAAVAADPLREHAWAQLITALYRSGARVEALAAFGRLRVMLISGYGIDPGPELQDLHKRVLADDPALLISTDSATAGLPSGLEPARPAGMPGTGKPGGELIGTLPLAGPPGIELRPPTCGNSAHRETWCLFRA
jgi:DNA-binding SARP family transcriptional activator